MAISIEIRERHKHHLGVLLNIKKRNPNSAVTGLDEDIKDAVMVMEQEDVAWVEKIVGIKAID
jgi:hypothetical protein